MEVNKHFKVSMVKSILRMAGYVSILVFSILWGIVALLVAEVIGILEEFV